MTAEPSVSKEDWQREAEKWKEIALKDVPERVRLLFDAGKKKKVQCAYCPGEPWLELTEVGIIGHQWEHLADFAKKRGM